MKPCDCGGSLIYGTIGPGSIGYACDKCGLVMQKKPLLPKGQIENRNKILTIINRRVMKCRLEHS